MGPMDQFWHAATDFLNSNGFVGRTVVGPVEMSEIFPIDRAYSNVTVADANQVDAVVLHKGRYRELDPGFLEAALARLRPGFANEVFVVLTADCPAPDDANPHLGVIKDIHSWIDSPGSAPTAPRARMSATYVGRGQVLAETSLGHLVILAASDRSITPHIIRDGYFDLGMTKFFQRFLRPGMVYVDVGANMGIYALIAASCVGRSGRVVAIEAIPRLAEIVTDNLGMNGFLPISTVLPVAAANMDGEVTIYEFDRIQGHNTLVQDVARMGESAYGEAPKPVQVRARRLADMFAEGLFPAPDVIKIDVEGFELEVVLGARALIVEHRPSLMLEWHPSFMTRAGIAEQLHDMLTAEFGYALYRIEHDGQTRPIEFSELMSLEHSDILARPDRQLPVPRSAT
jgi:FkbM family methyltransferase